MNTRTFMVSIVRAIGTAALLFALASSLPAQARSAAAANPETLPSPQPAPVTPVQTQAAQAAEVPGGGTEFPVIRTVGGFALVLSLILIAFFIARKIAPQYFNKRTAEKNLKVIESLSVGEKRSVALIQVGEKRFLIGNTPQQITLLSPLDNSFSLISETDKHTAEPLPANPVNPFKRLYEAERNRISSKPGKEKTIPPDVRAKMRQLREALEG